MEVGEEKQKSGLPHDEDYNATTVVPSSLCVRIWNRLTTHSNRQFKHTAVMIKSSLLRQVSRASATAIRPPTLFTAASQGPTRSFSNGASLREKHDESRIEDKHDEYSTAGKPGAFEHEGRFARTDESITVEYPEEHHLPSSKPVQGRGGFHFKRTLASFSLEGRVGVVTGGARGLGLVMSQALIVSGADVAIVDLNSTYTTAIPPTPLPGSPAAHSEVADCGV